ncbi:MULTISPECIES: glucuronate isomerase [unclassified Chelatococcus]|uniref:glucuronate isomerase n=1 Tax=unclassified Chelatococcus TaxID=2638111 RepID=UPI001BCDD61B|nr:MULTISPECIES: glucuronate isomerase [unclassified Chelatococcus]CAH1656538.1 Uronate isomerase [Hyphomicrobiales bacterium]MBS7740549.1 glucuronate isomerase [Chelatococcus sp. HY11]MBX3544667.1 glucuronate isomerase [Chelatococcus sp.]MCO5078208.1 glucuronate isomerase [Chelatococcus sp.]CAH1684710.1 Uronate isomerase [Hyphomicrobiales bacterium]
MTLLHDDRLFPADEATRAVARRLYAEVKDLPLICPHGHTDPRWYAENSAFPDPARLFVVPDHYIFRMLYSQGIRLEDLGIPTVDGSAVEEDPRKIWRLFASNYHHFRGTPTRLWLDHALATLFGVTERLSAGNADAIYDTIATRLESDAFRPRALFEQFNIEVIATTESPLDDLAHHAAIRDSGWKGRVVTAYRPDPVVDPEFDGFRDNVRRFGEITDTDVATFAGYREAHRKRRQFFKSFGATSTDHGHPTARTADLSPVEAEALYARVMAQGQVTPEDAELFRAQMLTEMAALSLEDGLVMQIHPGSQRNHNPDLFARFGRDKGADIPSATNYVRDLKPLLNRFGNERDLTVILFTLDETAYSRELAPMAGHYPCLRLGPAWWFYDSPEGMRRYRELVTETAGFYNTVGFNDDTRAFPSIPARHDVARRVDCAYLAELVVTHRLDEDEAAEVAHDLAYRLAKEAYKL